MIDPMSSDPTSSALARACCHCSTAAGELRPYGPKGAWICFDCAMQPTHLEETRRQFAQQIDAALREGGIPLVGGETIEDTEAGVRPLGGRRQ